VRFKHTFVRIPALYTKLINCDDAVKLREKIIVISTI
jgi:hypothetical protein